MELLGAPHPVSETLQQMCGRARCTLRHEEVAALAGVAPEAFVNGDKYRPCENMGPGRYGPVAFCARDSGSGSGEKKDWQRHKKLQAMRWGLIPSFTKPHAKPDHFMMFNARSESLHERPAFRRLLETKRCIIFSDGYYEWQQVDKREKQPYYIYRTTGPLKFAGLYDTWQNDDGEQMYSYTVLTTEASPEMVWMHTRMPVMLTDEGAARWLSEAKFDSLRDLLVGYRGDDLENHPVDRKVGTTKFQSEDCSKKIDIKHAAKLTSFFASSPPSKSQTRAAHRSSSSTSLGGSTPSSPHSKAVPAPTAQEKSQSTPPPPHHEPPITSQEDASVSSQTSLANTATATPSATRSLFPSQRSEALRSPIKFLFQQQHMVQQAEDILKASQAASASTSASATSTASGGDLAKPKSAMHHGSFVPASALVSEMGTKRSCFGSPPKHPAPSPKRVRKTHPSPKKPTSKNPQRGTLLAFFQPKS